MYLPGEIDGRVMSWSAGYVHDRDADGGVHSSISNAQPRSRRIFESTNPPVWSAPGVRAWMRSGLVVFQVCLSFILLVGAALLLESLQRFAPQARALPRRAW